MKHDLATAHRSDLNQASVPGVNKTSIELVRILFFAGLFFALIKFVSIQIRVESISMQPSLQPGDYVLVSRLAFLLSMPNRGDIIVFDNPADPSQQYIKRVIGLPGDMVFIAHGVVAINQTPLVEPYVQSPPLYANQWSVPNAAFFVLGDNRNHSSDSHVWGMLPVDSITGKALLIYWPPGRVRWLSSGNS